MATGKEYPLSLVIKAVDKATAPLRAINQRIQNFTAPVRKLGNSFKALSTEAGLPNLAKGFSGVGSAVGKVGRETLALGAKVAAMAGAAGFALFHIVKGAVDAGDKLGEMAQRVGMTADAYAQLQFAAGQADVEQEAFNGAMDQFNKRLGEAKAGTGGLLTFLNKVSPALAQQIKGASSTEEAFGLMTKAMEKVTDPGKRAALAAAAFGRSGLQMGQFLGTGTAAIEAQRKKFFELSGSQEEFAKGAGELDNAMRETEMAFFGLRSAAAGALFPALTELAKALSGILVQNRGGLKKWATETSAAISAWVKGGGLDRLVTGLREVASTVASVVEKVGGMKGVFAAVALVMSSGLIASVFSLTAALFNLGVAAAPLAAKLALLAPGLVPFVVAAAPFIAAAVGVAAAGYQIYKNWGDLKLFFTDFANTVPGMLRLAWAEMKPIFQAITMAMPGVGPLGTWAMTKFGDKFAGPKENTAFNPELAKAYPARVAAEQAQARVTVDFNNVPKGVRVTPATGNTAPLDLSVGPSMVTP